MSIYPPCWFPFAETEPEDIIFGADKRISPPLVFPDELISLP